MPSTCSRRAAALIAALTTACSWQPPPSMPRPPLPPPVPFAAVPPVTLESVTAHGGVLAAGDERVRFRRWGGTDAGGPPRPIVVLVPILAGGEDLLDGVARRLVDHGFDVAACERAGAALRPPQRALELDDLFARTVRHQRILLQWLRSAPPPPATFVLGLSMGGMVAAVVAAAEPSLDGVAICLSGADLGGLVVRSSEPRVRRWVEWRRSEDGIGDGELTWELRQYLRYEPLAFAAAVAAPKVLFVGAALDTVVPPRHQDLLWEALGRPGRLTVALGHYTAAAAIDPILGAAAAHFRACAPAAAAP